MTVPTESSEALIRFVRDVAKPFPNKKLLPLPEYHQALRFCTRVATVENYNLLPEIRLTMTPSAFRVYCKRLQDVFIEHCRDDLLPRDLKIAMLRSFGELLLDEKFVARYLNVSADDWYAYAELVGLSNGPLTVGNRTFVGRDSILFALLDQLGTVSILPTDEFDASDDRRLLGAFREPLVVDPVKQLLITFVPTQMLRVDDDDDDNVSEDDGNVSSSMIRVVHRSYNNRCSRCYDIVGCCESSERVTAAESIVRVVRDVVLNASQWCELCMRIPLFNVVIRERAIDPMFASTETLEEVTPLRAMRSG